MACAALGYGVTYDGIGARACARVPLLFLPLPIRAPMHLISLRFTVATKAPITRKAPRGKQPRRARDNAEEVDCETAEAEALQLRRAGMGYEKIAATQGVGVSTAHRRVRRAMDRLRAVVDERAGQVRELELDRLDAMLEVVLVKALAGDLGAVDRAIKISESRRKLAGVDAPASTVVGVVAEGEQAEPGTPARRLSDALAAALGIKPTEDEE